MRASARIFIAVFTAITLLFPIVAWTQDTAEPEIDPVFKQYVGLLNELTERRRVNTFFANEQSVFAGVQKGYVNVGTGNLTFVRRDLATVGRIPVILARVYDSSYDGPTTLSPGWRLSLAETITEDADGNLIYSDDSLTETHFKPFGTAYAITPAQPSDIQVIERVSRDTLKVHYRNHWRKTFKRIGDQYRLKRVKDGNGNTLTLKYRGNRLRSIQGQNGRFVILRYNHQGQISQLRDDQGRQVVYTYNRKAQLTGVKDVGGNDWVYRYSESGQLQRVKDPLGQVVLNVSYFPGGKVDRTRLRGIKHRYTYSGNTTEVKDENDNVSSFVQNDQGITVQITNAEGFVSGITLTDTNQVESLTHNGQARGEFSYDVLGNPARLIRYGDGGAVELSYRFDWQDRVVEIEATDGTRQTLGYDERGNLLSRNQSGQISQYKYNQQGDLIAKAENGNSSQYRHNADGLLIQLQQGEQTAQFDYSTTGRLSQITFPNGNQHQYQYDALGFRTRTARTDGSYINYQYDSTGNLREQAGEREDGYPVGEQITLNQSNQVVRVDNAGNNPLRITYDGQDNPIELKWNELTLSCEYDQQGRLSSLKNSGDGSVKTYSYAPGEADIRKQWDDRTAATTLNLRSASSSLQSLNTATYTRSSGTPWLVLRWDAYLSMYKLPTDVGLVQAGEAQLWADQRRRLYDSTVLHSGLQQQFDKASNSFFLPPEYASVNCGFECFADAPDGQFMSLDLFAPYTAPVGSWVNVQAYNPFAPWLCEDGYYEWWVDGLPAGSGYYSSELPVFINDDITFVELLLLCYCEYGGIEFYDAYTVIYAEEPPPPSCSHPQAPEQMARPVWQNPAPSLVSWPAVNNFSAMTTTIKWGNYQSDPNNPNKPQCSQFCSGDNEVWRITGGATGTLSITIAADLPIPSTNPPQYKARTNAQLVDSLVHEEVHRTNINATRQPYHSALDGEWSSEQACQDALSSANADFRNNIDQACRNECLHINHAGEVLYAIDPMGNQVPNPTRTDRTP